jgi:hypothetical protein
MMLDPEVVLAQGRTVRKIRTPEKPPQTVSTLASETCSAAVHFIARAWGTDRLRNALHHEFPNGPELIDSIRRLTLDATNLVLSVEAVEGMQFTQSPDGHSTDCIADVSTRLLFDDPESGERRTGSTGRAQWRIRLEQVPQRRAP